MLRVAESWNLDLLIFVLMLVMAVKSLEYCLSNCPNHTWLVCKGENVVKFKNPFNFYACFLEREKSKQIEDELIPIDGTYILKYVTGTVLCIQHV